MVLRDASTLVRRQRNRAVRVVHGMKFAGPAGGIYFYSVASLAGSGGEASLAGASQLNTSSVAPWNVHSAAAAVMVFFGLAGFEPRLRRASSKRPRVRSTPACAGRTAAPEAAEATARRSRLRARSRERRIRRRAAEPPTASARPRKPSPHVRSILRQPPASRRYRRPYGDLQRIRRRVSQLASHQLLACIRVLIDGRAGRQQRGSGRDAGDRENPNLH